MAFVVVVVVVVVVVDGGGGGATTLAPTKSANKSFDWVVVLVVGLVLALDAAVAATVIVITGSGLPKRLRWEAPGFGSSQTSGTPKISLGQ